MRTKSESTEKVSGYLLALPPDINIKPKYVVPVSKNYVARIYEVNYEHERKEGISPNGYAAVRHEVRTGYRISVRHAVTGMPHRNQENLEYRSRGASNAGVLETLLDVRFTLEWLVNALAPKTRTSRHEESDDE